MPRLLLPCCLIAILPDAALGETPRSDWPYYRHDRHLTARSPARGNLTEAPVIKWKYYLGGWHNRFVITHASGGRTSLSIPAQTSASSSPMTWDGTPLVDLAGDGKLVATPPGKVGRLLPNIQGLQSVQWSHLPNQPSRAVGRCYSYEEGADRPKLRWQTEEESEVYELLCTVGDVDGDSLLDVVFVTHYRALIYDGQTGKKKSTIQWPIGRNYGQITLADVDGDRLPEIVVVADSPPHVDVLKYRPDKGELLWSHRYITDDHVSSPIELMLYLVSHHVLDIDGDGHPEIIYNRYNFEKDHRWHVVIRDARTGKEKYNLPGHFIWGIADLGNGKPSLCCLRPRAVASPKSAQRKSWTFKKIAGPRHGRPSEFGGKQLLTFGQLMNPRLLHLVLLLNVVSSPSTWTATA